MQRFWAAEIFEQILVQMTSFLLVNRANTRHYKHRSRRFFPPILSLLIPCHHVREIIQTVYILTIRGGRRAANAPLYISDCFPAGDTLEHARVHEARLFDGEAAASEAAFYLGQAEGTGTSGVPAANRRTLEENSRINALIRST